MQHDLRKLFRVGFASMIAAVSSCGGQSHHQDAGPSLTVVEQAFTSASLESGVPARLMMATGYLESGLRPEKSSANYFTGDKMVSKSLKAGESAFGIELATLGLDESNGVDLPTQIKAYAQFIKAKTKDMKLPLRALTSEERMKWIWKFASIHRGESSQRNLLSVFSKEMMDVLNLGFSVQDSNGIVAKLEKEASPLKEADLPLNFQEDLRLDTYHADVRSAFLFSLARNNPSTTVNHPKRIEVIHCPFRLSTCIQLQDSQSTDSAPLGAHYLIPVNDQFVPGIIQFAHHDESLRLIGTSGEPEVVTDRIVVMLAGSSGRYKDGQRNFADPMWLSDFQLRLLSAAVSDICAALGRTEGVNREQCQTTGGDSGVFFRVQPDSVYHWGDIADFDETIFLPYLKSIDGISGKTSLTISPDTIQAAGSSFKLVAGFQATARRVEIERLVRCPAPDRRVVWEPVDQKQVRNVSTYTFENSWYDAGPNGTGDQFFRTKVSGVGGKFLGWSTIRVQLRDFEKEVIPEAPSKYCLRNGT